MYLILASSPFTCSHCLSGFLCSHLNLLSFCSQQFSDRVLDLVAFWSLSSKSSLSTSGRLTIVFMKKKYFFRFLPRLSYLSCRCIAPSFGRPHRQLVTGDNKPG